jgi:hypothetical protein
MVEPAAPLLHDTFPLQPVAVNIADSPLQSDVLLAVTVGGLGLEIWVITI